MASLRKGRASYRYVKGCGKLFFINSEAYEQFRNTLETGMDDALSGPIMSNQDTQRAIEILAKSVYRDLKQNGYSRADVLAFASSILEQVTSEAKAQQQTEARESV